MQHVSVSNRAPARRPARLVALLSAAQFALGLVACGGSNEEAQAPLAETPYTLVSTYAGSGDYGATDSPDTAARATFNRPLGVAADRFGNLYVADTFNHTIRKIAATGAVTTFAGSGTEGAVDGTGTAASFNQPRGIAIDYDGTVYVAEFGNHLIRKISPQGVVSTLAGTGQPGDADGLGTAAAFRVPEGIAVDSGTVYVADTFNHKIRRITADGQVTTLAGSGRAGAADGTGSAASFNAPVGIGKFNSLLFVGDSGNHMIRRIDIGDGAVTTIAGSTTAGSADGVGAAARFYHPEGVVISGGGDVYVADFDNHLIRKIDQGGKVTTVAGNGSAGAADGTGTAARFGGPFGLAMDNYEYSKLHVYVADFLNHSIRKLTLPSGVVSTVAGTGSSGAVDGAGVAPPAFRRPFSLALDSAGGLYVSDNGRVLRKVSVDGTVSTLLGDATQPLVGGEPGQVGPGSQAVLMSVGAIAVGSDGSLFVADGAGYAIRKVSASGVVSTLAGSGVRGSADGVGATASFSGPDGLVVDRQGTLYVADSSNHRIRMVTPSGEVTTLAGTGQSGSTDGAAASATFSYPTHLAIDGAGNLYVSDDGRRIRKIAKSGVVSTLAGGTGGSDDGKGTAASFLRISGMAFGPDGLMYVSDQYSVRKVTADGTVSTLAGVPPEWDRQPEIPYADGALSAARFDQLAGIAIAPDGRIFLADAGNRTIRSIQPAAPSCAAASCPGAKPSSLSAESKR